MNRQQFQEWTESARQTGGDFIVALVQKIIQQASADGVSDLHFQPDKDGLAIWFRYDGVLHDLGRIAPEYISQTAARLKVLADLLTYRTSVPQEGRVQADRVPGVSKEMRISTMPTLFGERTAIRFFAEEDRFRYPEQLGFSPDLEQGLIRAVSQKGGAVIICGPAGSGKTTTAYSLLRHLAARSNSLRSILTLEDPVEHPIPGTAQVEVTARSAALTVGESDLGSGGTILPAMIKYAMRQDPEILFVGEIRDRASAQAAFQAALTGHLLITTFHAGSAVEAVARLLEMGIEPFVLRSSINAVLSQRLLRKLCSCTQKATDPVSLEKNLLTDNKTKEIDLDLNGQIFHADEYWIPVGCEQCSQTGYEGRTVAAELIPWKDSRIAQAVLQRADSNTLQKTALDAGMKTIAQNAWELVQKGITSPVEVCRIL